MCECVRACSRLPLITQPYARLELASSVAVCAGRVCDDHLRRELSRPASRWLRFGCVGCVHLPADVLRGELIKLPRLVDGCCACDACHCHGAAGDTWFASVQISLGVLLLGMLVLIGGNLGVLYLGCFCIGVYCSHAVSCAAYLVSRLD
jgi:hypothetical protein